MQYLLVPECTLCATNERVWYGCHAVLAPSMSRVGFLIGRRDDRQVLQGGAWKDRWDQPYRPGSIQAAGIGTRGAPQNPSVKKKNLSVIDSAWALYLGGHLGWPPWLNFVQYVFFLFLSWMSSLTHDVVLKGCKGPYEFAMECWASWPRLARNWRLKRAHVDSRTYLRGGREGER